ncbi:MAG TPA: hypothetical protein VHF88_03115 [Thermoleophilaceae bacterium]|nr:hypothetical protein [Thermoleophilaceae bacterium]
MGVELDGATVDDEQRLEDAARGVGAEEICRRERAADRHGLRGSHAER